MNRRTRGPSLLLLGAAALALGVPAGTHAQTAPAPAAQAADPAPAPPAAPGALDAEFEQHLTRAAELTRTERYAEALGAWDAAYKLRQRPGLLLEIARTHRRLGNAQEASKAYRRYLAAEPSPPADARTEAEQALAQLDRLLNPGAAGTAAGASGAHAPLPPNTVYGKIERDGFVGVLPMRLELRPDRRLFAAGWTLLSLGYTAAFISGMTYGIIGSSSNSSRYDSGFQASAWTLLVPVLGPFISGILAPSMSAAPDRQAAGLTWSLPWMLVDGAVQVAGLALTIASYRHKRLVPVLAPLRGGGDRPQLSLRPYAGPFGGGLTMGGTF